MQMEVYKSTCLVMLTTKEICKIVINENIAIFFNMNYL